VIAAGFGFLAGRATFSPPEVKMIERSIAPEMSLVNLEKIDGDALSVEISGPVRVILAGENALEKSGEIFLGQIPTANDLKFEKFPFTGNAKTGKFYPSDSYFARGVEVKNRRFFETKQDAIDAGFIPSKTVK